ncbi:MAG: HigA family addiction module antitoxin [Nitrospira sp.]|nr:HigA family addiction module antitoxin [Nitrospira sp.]MCY4131602.1 HigA family addiction module antitoxin [Nitrospira sp.]
MDKQPKNPFHPGEMLLEEFLEPMGMSQAAFAQKTGWSRTRLNEVIRGKRGITADAALDLAETLGTSPKLWLNLQTTYDLAKASRQDGWRKSLVLRCAAGPYLEDRE